MYMRVNKERFDKLNSLLNHLNYLGQKLVNLYDKKVYYYKGKVWTFKYENISGNILNNIRECFVTVKDWYDYPHCKEDDNRWHIQDIIKETNKCRLRLSRKIRNITWMVPDSAHKDALSEGHRFNDDYEVFIRIRRGYHEDQPTLQKAVEAALLHAANWDWYDKYERE